MHYKNKVGILLQETEKAVLFKLTDRTGLNVWVPKSKCNLSVNKLKKGKIYTFGMEVDFYAKEVEERIVEAKRLIKLGRGHEIIIDKISNGIKWEAKGISPRIEEEAVSVSKEVFESAKPKFSDGIAPLLKKDEEPKKVVANDLIVEALQNENKKLRTLNEQLIESRNDMIKYLMEREEKVSILWGLFKWTKS
jgi:hypothetical protein